MSTALQKKLRIKPGMRLLTIDAPADFKLTLGAKETGLITSPGTKNFDQIHWFVRTQKEMEAELDKVIGSLAGEIVCWIYFPKGSSKMQTDLTRDTGWEKITEIPGLKWLSLVSFDDTWSTFAIRKATANDEKQKAEAKPREILDYIDPVKKTVTVPGDLSKALKADKQAAGFFNSLAYSHRKEYVEWIVTAKRDETRQTRVAATIERLKKSLKNPTAK